MGNMKKYRETQITQEQIVLAVGLYDKGYTLKVIATRLNIGTTLAWRIVNGKLNSRVKKRRHKVRRPVP